MKGEEKQVDEKETPLSGAAPSPPTFMREEDIDAGTAPPVAQAKKKVKVDTPGDNEERKAPPPPKDPGSDEDTDKSMQSPEDVSSYLPDAVPAGDLSLTDEPGAIDLEAPPLLEEEATSNTIPDQPSQGGQIPAREVDGMDDRQPGARRIRGPNYQSSDSDDDSSTQGTESIVEAREIDNQNIEDPNRIREEAAARALRDLTSGIVVAEEDPGAPGRQKRRRIAVLGVVVLAAVATTLGVVLGRDPSSQPPEIVLNGRACQYARPVLVGSFVAASLEDTVRSTEDQTVPACGTARRLWVEDCGTRCKAVEVPSRHSRATASRLMWTRRLLCLQVIVRVSSAWTEMTIFVECIASRPGLPKRTTATLSL